MLSNCKISLLLKFHKELNKDGGAENDWSKQLKISLLKLIDSAHIVQHLG